MVYYKVIHKHNLFDKIEKRLIGIFTTLELAEDAVNKLKKEIGFKQTSDGFKIVKIHRLFKPNYLDIIFYKKGFDTHKNDKKKTWHFCGMHTRHRVKKHITADKKCRI